MELLLPLLAFKVHARAERASGINGLRAPSPDHLSVTRMGQSLQCTQTGGDASRRRLLTLIFNCQRLSMNDHALACRAVHTADGSFFSRKAMRVSSHVYT